MADPLLERDMFGAIRDYTKWLHTRWPAGTVEKMPEVEPDGSTRVPGLYVVGDLTGIPLLKFSSDTGARAVRTIVADPAFQSRKPQDGVHDLVIIGAGVSGMAAALEARKNDLDYRIVESTQPFNTIVNFPKGKPIYTYPTDMTPAGELQFSERASVREPLIDELNEQTIDQGVEPITAHVESVVRKGGVFEVEVSEGENLRAHRVIVGIGRSGSYRQLDVPGEDSTKVSNRLHDPSDFRKKHVLVVGGGDSAMEASIALAQAGAFVTVSYRKAEFSRPKLENEQALRELAANPFADVAVEHPTSGRVTTASGDFMGSRRRPGSIRLMMSSNIKKIDDEEVVIEDEDGEDEILINDHVFTMIGREAPLDFFRRSGVPIRGEWRLKQWLTLLLAMSIVTFVYHWKKTGVWIPIGDVFAENTWFPYNLEAWWGGLGAPFANPANLLGVLRISIAEPGFYYTLAYCVLMLVFGIKRIKRRRTPYVTRQTTTLIVIQFIPLFLLPYILLPWLGNNGWFETGVLGSIADSLFPEVGYGHGREYWRSFGFILAWPLFIWNVFTNDPLWGWLAISFVQTFVIIPLIVWRWGKGAYCGWICSCGGMAETMGDTQRQKMPHGPVWNRLNMLGQVFLAFALLIFVTRVLAWISPDTFFGKTYVFLLKDMPILNYVWFVDLFWAGILGFGLYFHFSGRVWCRFACPLAALMHIYARFSQFRILADKKKCISCNVCTSVCHQGIDIMNFANKGLPMEDPECVRCSACVQSCPTGVLEFGRINRKTGEVLAVDRLPASPVRMAELTVNGARI